MQTIPHRNRYTPIPGIKHPISKKTEFIYIYNSKLNKLKSKQNELENISGTFYKDYSKTKSNFFYVDPFIEIKTKYREMGYERECNLTRQSSLFKPTPLLLHNDAINLFYKNKVLLNLNNNNNNNTSSTTTVHSHSPQMQIDGGKPAMYLQKLQKEITRVNTQPKKLRVLRLFQKHLFNNNSNNTINPSLSNNVILQLRSNVFNNSNNDIHNTTTTKTKSTDRVIKHKHIIQENKQLKEYNNKLQSTIPSHEIDENFTSRIRRDTVRKIAFEHAVKQFGNLIDDDDDNDDNERASTNNNINQRQTINVLYKRDHKKKKNTIVFKKDNNLPSTPSSYRKNNFKFKTLMTNNFAKTKNDEKTHNRLIHLVNRMKDNKVSFAEFHNKVEQLPINKETIGDWINKSYKVNKTENEKTKLNKVLTSTHPNTLVQLVYQSKTKANAYDIENASPLKVKGVLLRKMKDVNTTINQIDKDVMSKIINSIHQE